MYVLPSRLVLPDLSVLVLLLLVEALASSALLIPSKRLLVLGPKSAEVVMLDVTLKVRLGRPDALSRKLIVRLHSGLHSLLALRPVVAVLTNGHVPSFYTLSMVVSCAPVLFRKKNAMLMLVQLIVSCPLSPLGLHAAKLVVVESDLVTALLPDLQHTGV